MPKLADDSKPYKGLTALPDDLALIALGSNLGDRQALLESALFELERRCELEVLVHSTWHTTAPVGGPAGQGDFKNGVALLRSALAPLELLRCLQTIELMHGRTREVEWGPRTLDLDLLMVGTRTHEDGELTLPHPRMCERDFVLEPLAELCPELTLATGETVAKACIRLRAKGADQSR